MAITPEQASKPTSEEERQVKSLERIIDSHLQRTPADAGGGRRYDIPPRTSEKTIGELIKLYAAAGWKVKREYGDQREPANELYFQPTNT